jgi:hypothetical protein
MSSGAWRTWHLELTLPRPNLSEYNVQNWVPTSSRPNLGLLIFALSQTQVIFEAIEFGGTNSMIVDRQKRVLEATPKEVATAGCTDPECADSMVCRRPYL